MAKFYDELTPALTAFIQAQKMFFTATAAPEGRVNVSPKGTDSFRVLDPRTVGYLDMTGSGNETAAHIMQCGRLTLMFCAFEGKSKILRLYGNGRVIPHGSPDWTALIDRFADRPGARQIMLLDIDSLQTSCGFGVPLYSYLNDREELSQWVERKGPDGITDFWDRRNRESIDGSSTGIDRQL